jgi:hypothetical protein
LLPGQVARQLARGGVRAPHRRRLPGGSLKHMPPVNLLLVNVGRRVELLRLFRKATPSGG